MKAVHINISIECLSAIIISRKIVPSTFLEVRTYGKCFTYKCSRNSEAEIAKELDPKESVYNKHSLLDIGTKLECENLFVAVHKKKPYTPEKINHTGRHKAQTFTTKEFTFAKISKQIHNIPDCDPPVKFCLIEEKKDDNKPK